ncbi:hypothetical protein GGF31_005712 [Allomyces arbusculus]|nr:hypothetical protein GGF31_005712 [Allomyces arbusculus]
MPPPPPPPPPTSTPPPPARAPVLPRPAHHDSRVRLLRAARQRAHSFAADGHDEFDHDRDHAAVAAAAAHVAVAIGMGHDQRDDKQHLLQAGGGRDMGRWLALPSATAADDRHHELHRRHSSHLGTSTTPPTRGSPRPRPRSATSTCTCASASAAAVAALPLALSQETLDRVGMYPLFYFLLCVTPTRTHGARARQSPADAAHGARIACRL